MPEDSVSYLLWFTLSISSPTLDKPPRGARRESVAGYVGADVLSGLAAYHAVMACNSL